jgi:hypothetical protein
MGSHGQEFFERRNRFERSLPVADDDAFQTRQISKEEIIEFREWLRRNRDMAPSRKYVDNWIYRINRHLFYNPRIDMFKLRVNPQRAGRIGVAIKLKWG